MAAILSRPQCVKIVLLAPEPSGLTCHKQSTLSISRAFVMKPDRSPTFRTGRRDAFCCVLDQINSLGCFFILFGDLYLIWWSRGYICNSSYNHHHMGSITLSHCCHFFRGCMSGRLYHHILSVTSYRGRESCFPLLLCSLWCIQIIK